MSGASPQQLPTLVDEQIGRPGHDVPAFSMAEATYGLCASPRAIFIMPPPAGWDLPISQWLLSWAVHVSLLQLAVLSAHCVPPQAREGRS